MSTAESLFALQFDLHHAISRVLVNVKKKGAANITESYVQARLDTLLRNWDEFRANHVKLQDLCTPEARKHDYYVGGLRHTTEDLVVDTQAVLCNMLAELTPRPPASTEKSHGNHRDQSQPASSAKLRRLDVPTFSGDYQDWPLFKALFASLVLSNDSLSSTEKFHYLLLSVHGEALDLIRNLPVDGAHFDRAWQLIVGQYENTRVLVDNLLGTLFSLPAATSESAAELKRIRGTVKQVLNALEVLKCQVQHWGPFIIYWVTQRLDPETLKAWELQIADNSDYPEFSVLDTFLEHRIRALAKVESTKPVTSVSKSRAPGAQSHATIASQNRCILCCADHYLGRCAQYLAKTPEQRKQLVTQHRRCYNCLGNHPIKVCRHTTTCMKCASRHHTSLHDASISSSASSSSSESEPIVEAPPAAAHHVMPASLPVLSRRPMILATALVTILSTNGDNIRARVLLDQGSEVSFIKESICQRLRLPRQHARMPIYGIGAGHTVTTRGVSTFVISSLTQTYTCEVKAFILPELTHYAPAATSPHASWDHIQGLQLADPSYLDPQPIDMVIGVDVYSRIIRPDIRRGDDDSPVAQLTTLGWVISGPASTVRTHKASNGISSFQCGIDRDLYELVQKFWVQEEPNALPATTLTDSERQCENHFRTTHSRDDTGRYVVRLPFAKSAAELGDSRSSALQILRRSEKTLASRPQFRDKYAAFLTEYEHLGHMRMVTESENRATTASYVLPHHGVLRGTGDSAKIRVVFNGSHRTTSGTSLNDCLHVGPKLQTDLADIILRWRRFRFAFSADVEKMYRQIRVHESDQIFQRIVWRPDVSVPVQEYALTTVTYGLACAPFLAIRCMHQLASDEGDNFPLARDVLVRETYVDDILSGANDLQTAQEKVRQLQGLLKAGGFALKKWVANCDELIPAEERRLESSDGRTLSIDAPHRAPGVAWNTDSDTFAFSFQAPSTANSSKRGVLSTISQLFDPLGWLTPVTVQGKILMQELWTQKTGWDDALPAEFSRRWEQFCSDLTEIRRLTLTRWVGQLDPDRGIELHGFADASTHAMGVAIYMRVRNDDDTFRVTLLSAKSRVAPIKPITIPRLELSAALLLAKQVAHIRAALDIETIPTHLWTDSSVALAWIRSPPSRWKDFVRNRVADIHRLAPHAYWHHVPGTCNPADLASRGVSPLVLLDSIWWRGPGWLQEFSPAWPTETLSPEPGIDVEKRPEKPLTLHAASAPSWTLIDRYSSLTRLLRITSLCIRAVRRMKVKRVDRGPVDSITTTELEQARLFWIRQTQEAHFSRESQAVHRGVALPNASPLAKLMPFADAHGILRVGGRLQHSLLDADQNHPIILPRSSPFTSLVIAQAHFRTLHAGTQLTLSTVRQSYWIVGGRQPVRSFIKQCVTCARHSARQCTQVMGQLPARRITPARAFVNSGVDYAGPFQWKTTRGRGAKTFKGYLVVFVCMATGAVHLEFASDYSADAFIAAYKRFTGRRGICSTLTSDCGTNFVGADAELRRMFNRASQEAQAIASSLANLGTQWRFNPPSAPHFGGKWEAAVKSTKFHLRRVIGESQLTFEEYATLLAQIEAALNSRPICPLSDDSSDLSALTPGHFLIGDALNVIPEPNFADTPRSRLSRWQLLRQMLDHFWSRWSKEYLQQLQAASKWHSKSEPFRNGDLVLVRDERTPPAKWPLARVTDIHPGKDDVTRVVTVRTATTTLKRPIVKLCRLPVETKQTASCPTACN
ncbi:uncharacterized protein LOC143215865 [Lasioglossum baleicum]|uniref:uncharacterized protein LOC143215865 n=1 Tax=Lasioglossum baleicum TaxID=434251 RepID=UPI003FCCB224